MSIKDIFINNKAAESLPAVEAAAVSQPTVRTEVPDKMWIKCPGCRRSLLDTQLERTRYKVCPICQHHFRLTAEERVEQVCDLGTFERFDWEIPQRDPLQFPGYREKLRKISEETGAEEAVLCGTGKIHGEAAVLAVMDSHFFMGSMGSYVGEAVTRSVEEATRQGLPVLIFTCSGGARMQEGIVSLMQMAKVSGALERQTRAGLPCFTVLTDPTTGGVTASFAMLGDIIIAEKGALIGFAGKRVIEQTIKQKLPADFQSAEFALEHGFVDIVTERRELKDLLSRLLRMHRKDSKEEGVSA